MRTRSLLTCLAALVLANGAAQAQGGQGDPSSQGDTAAGKQKAARCAACHGADGNSPSPQWPKLAGQHASYTAHQLQLFQSGVRQNAAMAGMVAGLSEHDRLDLAAYFESQSIQPGAADEALVDLGRRIYRGGDSERAVPACSACHGPRGQGNPGPPYPSLAGQHAQYVAQRLRAYAEGADYAAAQPMVDIAGRLTDKQIEAVASYVQGLH